MNTTLVLASNSPRRRSLLAAAGFQFEVRPPKIAERHDVDLTPRELTTWNAVRKGLAIARRCPDAVILSADTIVVLGRAVLGKPRDTDEAVEMLRRLSGRVHEVCSAVFICEAARGSSTTFHETSRVKFRRLNDAAIRRYIAKVHVLDKAGAYAAQEHAADIIERVDGSYTNVVGLPMEKTTAALADFRVRPKEI